MPGNRFLGVTAALCVTTIMAMGTALAFDEQAFDAAKFKAAQQSGKSILVDAYAPWCPVCRAQHSVFEKLKQDAKFGTLTVFKIDYDHQPDALKALNVHRQSTLIAFKGEKETGRTVGDTNPNSIEALLQSAVN